MGGTGSVAKKRAADVRVLRCLNPSCGGMLAYEVTGDNVLYLDLTWTARREGDLRYLPCPRCRGRNVLEEVHDASGVVRHRVARFVPG
jgi:hypothetical protein